MLDKNYLLIKIVMKMRRFYERLGVDFEHFIWILRLKLTLDNRKQTIQEAMNNKPSKWGAGKQNLLVLGLIGVFMGLLMPMPLDLYYKVSVLSGMNLFFLVMYMVSDFSTVLLDVNDSTVIMTKPVNPKTMNAARITHIAYYMLSMFMALNAASFVLGTIAYGPLFLLAMVFMMFSLSFLIIFLTTILYSLLLKFFSGEKLKDILNMLQIVLAVITVIGYQLMGRMFEFVELELTVTVKWWSYLLPSSWYAGLFKWVVEGTFTTEYVVMTGLAVMVPLILGLLLKAFILSRYEKYLMKLSIEGQLVLRKKGPFRFFKEWLMKVFASDHIEFAFMKFTDANLTRDRKLKLLIYPNHVLGLIFPFIMLINFFRGSDGFYATLESLNGGAQYLFLYMASMFLMINFDLVKYSSNGNASVIFDSFPVKNKAVFYRGALKAYYLKFILPSMLFLSVLFGAIFGTTVISGIVLINVMTVLAMVLKGFVAGIFVPFTSEMGTTGNKNLGAAFAMMAVMGAIAGGHYLLLKMNPLFIWVAIVVALVAIKIFSFGLLKKKVAL